MTRYEYIANIGSVIIYTYDGFLDIHMIKTDFVLPTRLAVF
jgi:hypothetical protein